MPLRVQNGPDGLFRGIRDRPWRKTRVDVGIVGVVEPIVPEQQSALGSLEADQRVLDRGIGLQQPSVPKAVQAESRKAM